MKTVTREMMAYVELENEIKTLPKKELVFISSHLGFMFSVRWNEQFKRYFCTGYEEEKE